MDTTYLFTDIEADGPVPGLYSMLSFASVAASEDGKILAEFECNLLPLDGATQFADTMKWWSTQPDAWSYCQIDRRHPEDSMKSYAAWIASLPGKPVMAAHPASYDSMWMQYYSHRFLGMLPFPAAALDLKTLAMAALGRPFSSSSRSAWPPSWLGGHDHSHRAIDDARGYAHAFFQMKAEIDELHAAVRTRAAS